MFSRLHLAFLLMLCCLGGTAVAQNTLNRRDNNTLNGYQVDPRSQPDAMPDSVEVITPAPRVSQWRIDSRLGQVIPMMVDTVPLNFQNEGLAMGPTGHFNTLGNMGAPRLERIYAYRPAMGSDDEAPTMFLQPFSQAFQRINQQVFTNSNIPFTNLSYWKAGNKLVGEERFKTYLSINANKRMAFGFNIDYQYGRGYYANQSAAHYNGGIFASYMGNHYQMHATYQNFYLKQNENGGIEDDRYITHPEDMAQGGKLYETNNIPVNLEGTSNRNHHMRLYLTHRYRLGFSREQLVAKPNGKGTDSTTVSEFVPVTSFIHTLAIERSRHNFHSAATDADQFPTPLLGSTAANDSTLALSVRNVFGIALLEGFNRYAKAGLTAFLEHKYSRYTLMDMEAPANTPANVRYNENELYLGGELAKRQGRLLHYNLTGRMGLAGMASGQYSLSANADANVPFFSDTLRLEAEASLRSVLPQFYMRHYHSNYYAWDNDDLDKQVSTRLQGGLSYMRTGTSVSASLENISHYTYFGPSSTPLQTADDVKVATLSLRQNFKAGIFHLENEAIWQKTSNASALPLPTWSLYHNLYLLTKIAKKVLTVQMGADVRYFTKYNAPAWSPAIQQFRTQGADEAVSIGAFPIVNVYANMQLKRTRIFVMMYHVNSGMGSKNYFLSPHYPMNPSIFKFGLSWNFYD